MARDRWLLAAVLLLAGGLAWHARFVLDDAFIVFQYVVLVACIAFPSLVTWLPRALGY